MTPVCHYCRPCEWENTCSQYLNELRCYVNNYTILLYIYFNITQIWCTNVSLRCHMVLYFLYFCFKYIYRFLYKTDRQIFSSLNSQRQRVAKFSVRNLESNRHLQTPQRIEWLMQVYGTLIKEKKNCWMTKTDDVALCHWCTFAIYLCYTFIAHSSHSVTHLKVAIVQSDTDYYSKTLLDLPRT